MYKGRLSKGFLWEKRPLYLAYAIIITFTINWF